MWPAATSALRPSADLDPAPVFRPAHKFRRRRRGRPCHPRTAARRHRGLHQGAQRQRRDFDDSGCRRRAGRYRRKRLIRMKELAEQAATGTTAHPAPDDRIRIPGHGEQKSPVSPTPRTSTASNCLTAFSPTSTTALRPGLHRQEKIHFGTANDFPQKTITTSPSATVRPPRWALANSAYVGTGKYVLSETKTTLKRWHRSGQVSR